MAADSRGNVLLVDTGNDRVRRVDGDGVVSTIAGSDTAGVAGDGGLATETSFQRVVDVAVAADGSWFVSDYGSERSAGSPPTGSSPRSAGTGGSSADACAPVSALAGPTGLFARDGMLYIADEVGNTISRVALGT